MNTFTCVMNLTGHTGAIYALEQLPDGTLVSGAADFNVMVWNITTGTSMASFNPASNIIYAIAKVGPQTVAIAPLTTEILFYNISGSSYTMIKTISLSVHVLGLYSLVLLPNYNYNNVTKNILFAGCDNSYGVSVDVTNLNSISSLLTTQIISTKTGLYSAEKSSKILFDIQNSTLILIKISYQI